MSRIKYLPKAEQFIKKIREKNLKMKFKQAIKDIRSDPELAGELKKGDLANIFGYDIYYQGTNYEIAYYIELDEKGNFVVIVLAGTRENFYEELKRYIKKTSL